MVKRILIVGGTGFIGYHLAKKSINRGWRVSSISTKYPPKKRRLSKVNYIICDITDKKKLKRKINKYFDYVVNLGGHVIHSNKFKTLNSHYNGCKNLVDILIKKPPKKFIQMGSGNEYGKVVSPHKEIYKCKPNTYYGNAKLQSTKYLLKINKKKFFPSVILRLYQAYGPKQDMNRLVPQAIQSFLKNKRFNSSSGSQLRDFVHIDDVVKAIINSIFLKSNQTQIINIGSGKPITVKNMVLNILKIVKTGKTNFGKIKMRKDEHPEIYPNVSKAKKIIKWSAKIPLMKGLRQTVKSYDE